MASMQPHGEFDPIGYLGAPFQSDRYFKLWKYHVLRRDLLIRSTFDAGPRTTIDVHFSSVRLMVLRSSYAGLNIRERTLDEASEVEGRYRMQLGKGSRLYVLETELTSFVVSGIMQWYEDSEVDIEAGVFGIG